MNKKCCYTRYDFRYSVNLPSMSGVQESSDLCHSYIHLTLTQMVSEVQALRH